MRIRREEEDEMRRPTDLPKPQKRTVGGGGHTAPTYEKRMVGGSQEGWYVYICPHCTAIVYDTGRHDEFHASLARTALEADRAAMFTRPI